MSNYPCDGPDGLCPYDAVGGYDCRNYCGLGVDENEEEMEINNYVLSDDVKNMLKKLYLDNAKEWRRDAKDYHRIAARRMKSNEDSEWFEMMEKRAIEFAEVLEHLARKLYIE